MPLRYISAGLFVIGLFFGLLFLMIDRAPDVLSFIILGLCIVFAFERARLMRTRQWHFMVYSFAMVSLCSIGKNLGLLPSVNIGLGIVLGALACVVTSKEIRPKIAATEKPQPKGRMRTRKAVT